MTLIPRPYQSEAIELSYRRNVLNADACGLGKTLVAIEACRRLPPGPKLIVTPKRVRFQWMEAITEQDPSATVYVFGAAGKAPEDFSWENIRARYNCWVVTHYESLLKIGQQLSSFEWEVIVADEAHRIKNRKARRTLWLKQIKGHRKLALSGTPMEKTPSDLWSLVNWLYPKDFTSFWKWDEFFCEYEENPFMGFRKYVGPKNSEKLAEIMAPFTIKRSKEDVAPMLPPKIIQTVKIDLDGQQDALYTKIASNKDIELDVSDIDSTRMDPMIIRTVLSKIVKLQQVASDPMELGFVVPSAKIEWVIDWLDDNPDPVVIFTRFRGEASRLASKIGSQAALLVGGMKDQHVQIAGWLSGRQRVLVGTIAAMGEGLNLQRATTEIFVDQEWSTILMQQAVDRVHRINITEPKHIIYLNARDTVDELIMKALQNKWSDSELVWKFIKEYQ